MAPGNSGKKGVIACCLAALLVALYGLTWRQAHIYKDIETLWQDTLNKNPDSLLAHANMGQLEDQRGNTELAMKHYYKALEIYPDDEVVNYNLGLVFKNYGKLEESIAYYRKAIQLRPDFAAAHTNLANALKMQGNFDLAVTHYRTALRIDPRDLKTHYNLANTYRQLGKLDKAAASYQRAVDLDPRFEYARTNLAVTLEAMGKIREAMRQYQAALEIDPNTLTALNALAELLIRHPDPNMRDVGKAVTLAEHAATLTGGNDPVALNTLAIAYAAAGNKDKAVKTAQKAIDIAAAGGNKALADFIRKWMEQYRQSN